MTSIFGVGGRVSRVQIVLAATLAVIYAIKMVRIFSDAIDDATTHLTGLT
jgi:hypothetical protein